MDNISLLTGQFLSSTWGAAVLWFGGAWGIILFIRKITKDADKELNPDKRQELSNYLLGYQSNNNTASWIPNFTLVFDRFFGEKHFALTCFYRSVLISVVSFSVLMIIFENRFSFFSVTASLSLILVGICFNGLIDFISLLQTRYILSTKMPIVLKVFVDFIGTILLTFTWIFIGVFLLGTNSFLDTFEALLVIIFPTESESINSPVYRAIMITSFTTSIWLWLHGLAELAIKAVNSIHWMVGWLDVKNKPMCSIGTVSNIITFALAVLLFPLYLAVK